jgi:hypothetical protein
MGVSERKDETDAQEAGAVCTARLSYRMVIKTFNSLKVNLESHFARNSIPTQQNSSSKSS